MGTLYRAPMVDAAFILFYRTCDILVLEARDLLQMISNLSLVMDYRPLLNSSSKKCAISLTYGSERNW